jgi:hypothetical protein
MYQPKPYHRGLNMALWLAQVLVALAFGAGGVMKLALPIADLAAMWPWAGDLPPAIVRLLGAIDLLGGAGILLPSLTRIKPALAVTAAACCIALQCCAMAFHAARGEIAALPVNLVLCALCAFVLWGRWKKCPVAPRTP